MGMGMGMGMEMGILLAWLQVLESRHIRQPQAALIPTDTHSVP